VDETLSALSLEQSLRQAASDPKVFAESSMDISRSTVLHLLTVSDATFEENGWLVLVLRFTVIKNVRNSVSCFIVR